MFDHARAMLGLSVVFPLRQHSTVEYH